jgi:hypothetical protein
MDAITFFHQDIEYQFTVKSFTLDGRSIKSVDAVNDEALLNSLVEMGAGVIRKIGVKEKQSCVQHQPDNTIQVKNAAVVNQIQNGVKSDLATQAWSEYHSVKLERKKLSSQIFRMVEDRSTKAQLKHHYAAITDLQQREGTLYERARFVEQNGKLPETTGHEDHNILQLKDKRRKLVDQRCKLQKKIDLGKAKNPNRFSTWQQDLDRANAEYTFIDEQIQKLTGRA